MSQNCSIIMLQKEGGDVHDAVDAVPELLPGVN